MSSIDDLPDQLEELFSRARAGLNAQIGKARTAVDSLNAERAVAANALAELNDQIEKAKADLDAVLSGLGRASSLAGLNTEIAGARKTLEALKTKIGEETKAFQKVSKEHREVEAQLNAQRAEVTQLVAQRAYSQEVMAKLRQQVAQCLGLLGGSTHFGQRSKKLGALRRRSATEKRSRQNSRSSGLSKRTRQGSLLKMIWRPLSPNLMRKNLKNRQKNPKQNNRPSQ